MSLHVRPSLHIATSLEDAVAALAERGPDAAPMAGATWIMRAPLRDEAHRPAYVALSAISELGEIAVTDDALVVGACVTHARLAEALAGHPAFRALAQAAGGSANPAIRAVATLGGNLAAAGFAAADLVPALLCLDATVELAGPGGPDRMPLARYLDSRGDLAPGTLVARVSVPRSDWQSVHVRLPLRMAGDYPVAIVSLAVSAGADGRIAEARVAVGAVETVARRWPQLEARLAGAPADPDAAAAAARDLRNDFDARDGVEAGGAYRLRVLPALVRRAVAGLAGGGK